METTYPVSTSTNAPPSSSANSQRSRASLRRHPVLRGLFQSAEGRHLTESELEEYVEAAPSYADCAAAAKEISRCQAQVVERTVNYILENYPFEKHYPEGRAKCMRDVGNVAIYAMSAMLMNDPEWLRDKFLLWLRTILQAFMFPKREMGPRPAFNKTAKGTDQVQQLPQKTQALFETYSRLQANFQEQLSPGSFELLRPYLQQTIDTLTAE